MINKFVVIKVVLIILFLVTVLGCSQIMNRGNVEEIEYLIVAPSGNYTPEMSSVPGLPISIETDENIATENVIIKIRYSGGRLLRSTASFEWDRELYILDLDYEDRTIYWTPYEEDGVFTEGDENIVMEVFDQEEVVERKVFSIVCDDGFYFLEESE